MERSGGGPHTAPLQTRFTEEKRERNKNDDDDDDVEDKEGPRYRDGMMAIAAEPHCSRSIYPWKGAIYK